MGSQYLQLRLVPNLHKIIVLGGIDHLLSVANIVRRCGSAIFHLVVLHWALAKEKVIDLASGKAQQRKKIASGRECKATWRFEQEGPLRDKQYCSCHQPPQSIGASGYLTNWGRGEGGPSLRDPWLTRQVNVRDGHALIGKCEEIPDL
jgi:hypothetical protein